MKEWRAQSASWLGASAAETGRPRRGDAHASFVPWIVVTGTAGRAVDLVPGRGSRAPDSISQIQCVRADAEHLGCFAT